MNLFETYPRFDISVARAEGVYIYDEKNTEYLDLYGGHGVISIGHGHKDFNNNLQDQLSKICFYSNSVQIPLQNNFAKKLGELSNYPDYKLFLCNSGAESNENALKLASFHTGKNKVIAFKGGFHGRTAAALNVTDNPNLSALINKDNFEVVFVSLNDKDALTAALKNKDVAAVLIEGIQGVGGLDQATEDYFQFIEEACKIHEALLILDEIQSGYGRTGLFFAHQHSGIKADIITTAKGMGNGFPIGGVLISPKIEAKFGLLGTTFGGNPLACAAGLAVLETIERENLMENVKVVSAYLKEELSSIPKIGKIKGNGLMLGVDLGYPIKELRLKLLNDFHIFTGASSNPNVLRVLPPLCITKSQIEPFIKALKTVLV